jgi:hypothetical protein
MDVMDRVLGDRGNTYCSASLATSLAVSSEHEVQQVVTALADLRLVSAMRHSMLVVRP